MEEGQFFRNYSYDYLCINTFNGSFYIFKRKNFFKSKNRLHGKITYFEMPKESIFEVDEKEDLQITEKLIAK